MAGRIQAGTRSKHPPIAITLGDPAGIRPEVAAKALADPRLPRGFQFEVVGRATGHTPGRATLQSARGALRALNEAVEGCRSGRFSAMVTGPVQKETLARISPGFVGQTEFLARACSLPDEMAVMILTDPKLTVALTTNHCSLREALRRLTPQGLTFVATITHGFLRQLGIAKPRLGLAQINPHGGENGLFGDEEARLIAPALAQSMKLGLAIEAAPADTLFHRAVQKKQFDAVICAYHDQGLIPFKLVAFETGVNVTVGLPLIRTSPDHGTGLDIAGRGVADHRSMLAAIQLACRLVRGAP